MLHNGTCAPNDSRAGHASWNCGITAAPNGQTSIQATPSVHFQLASIHRLLEGRADLPPSSLQLASSATTLVLCTHASSAVVAHACAVALNVYGTGHPGTSV